MLEGRRAREAGMVRTNLYIGNKQHGELEAIVEETGLPMAELIRRSIDLFIDEYHRRSAMGAGKDKQAVQATKVTKVKGKAQKPATKTAKKQPEKKASAAAKKPAKKASAGKKVAAKKAAGKAAKKPAKATGKKQGRK